MTGLQILRTEDICEENLEEKVREGCDINLPDGRRLMQHEELAYENLFKDGRSFDKLDGSGSSSIEFSFDFKVHPNGVKEMKEVGNAIQSNSWMLQHNAVMYSFAYQITAVAKKDDDLLCKFHLFPVSHTYKHSTEAVKGGYKSNMSQVAPKLQNVHFEIEGTENTFHLKATGDGTYEAPEAISHKQLLELTKDTVAVLKMKATVEEAYFDIKKYFPLDVKEETPTEATSLWLQKILSGEKTPKSDWVITVNEGEPSSVHVHGPVLADASFLLSVAMNQHMSSSDDQILMVSHENRMIFSKLHAKDLRVILTYCYERRCILPDYDSYARVGRFLGHVFRDQIGMFLETWQSKMVKQMLQLDRTKGFDTIVGCVENLVGVACSPPGAFIAAYNVGLVVAADAWQIAEAKGVEDIEKKLMKKFPDIGIMSAILDTIKDYRMIVSSVSKRRI